MAVKRALVPRPRVDAKKFAAIPSDAQGLRLRPLPGYGNVSGFSLQLPGPVGQLPSSNWLAT